MHIGVDSLTRLVEGQTMKSVIPGENAGVA